MYEFDVPRIHGWAADGSVNGMIRSMTSIPSRSACMVERAYFSFTLHNKTPPEGQKTNRNPIYSHGPRENPLEIVDGGHASQPTIAAEQIRQCLEILLIRLRGGPDLVGTLRRCTRADFVKFLWCVAYWWDNLTNPDKKTTETIIQYVNQSINQSTDQ